jgi:hypothetical protein
MGTELERIEDRLQLEISDEMKEALIKNEQAAIEDLQHVLGISPEVGKELLERIQKRYNKQIGEMLLGKEMCENLVDRKKRSATYLTAGIKGRVIPSVKKYKGRKK